MTRHEDEKPLVTICAITPTTPFVPMLLNQLLCYALIDSGACISAISAGKLEELSKENDDIDISTTDQAVKSVNNQPLDVKGIVNLECSIGSLTAKHPFLILDNICADVVIGSDFIKEHGLIPNQRHGQLKFTNPSLPNVKLVDQSGRFVAAITKPPEQFKINTELSTAEREAIKKILPSNLFAESSTGALKGYEHAIDTGTTLPIRTKLRRYSPGERKIMDTEVDKMLQAGVIRPSQSPWASPVVLVPKPGNEVRFCVDYRKLNDVTKKDRYPLPQINDMLQILSGCKYFSKLDLRSGYWQIPMHPDSIEKTAFLCHKGLFEFIVMPFGLTNPPATFQRCLVTILEGLVWKICAVFIDDILIFGPTLDEHNHNLAQVVERLLTHGAICKATKCEFGLTKVVYLGFLVSGEGIHPVPEKIVKLKDFPRPTSVTGVKAFIGLSSYYRRFIRDFAQRSAPLNQLLLKDTKFEWTEACQNAFNDIKNSLQKDAVIAYPDMNKPFILDTDASATGLGAILSQKSDNGSERIVAADSRQLTPAERKWHIREQEALAIIWGLEHFRPFVYGAKLLIRTDHSPLLQLTKAKNARLQRWAIRLSEFEPFEVIFRSGKKHANADAFSRIHTDSDFATDAMTFNMISTSQTASDSDGKEAILCAITSQQELANEPWLQALPHLQGKTLQFLPSAKQIRAAQLKDEAIRKLWQERNSRAQRELPPLTRKYGVA